MTSCRKNCQCEAFGCDMPTCRQVCQCGGVTGGPVVAETCGTTGEVEDRGTKDIPTDEQSGGDNGGGTKDIPDDETDGGNATSPMQPMPDGGNATSPGADGGDDRNYPPQPMPPVPAPTPRRPSVPRPPTPCKFLCGGGEGGTESNRNRNDANNRNEQVGPDMAPNIESDEGESFDLSYLYDLLRRYVGYDVMMDSGSANEGTLAVASDTNYVVGADAAVKN